MPSGCAPVQGDQGTNTLARDVCVDKEVRLHTPVSAKSNDVGAPASLVHQVCLGVCVAGSCSVCVRRRMFCCALMLLVGWQEGHPACKKLSGGVLVWSSLWSDVQTCIWPS